MAITAMKVDYPEPKEFPTGDYFLWKPWQLDLIFHHLPEKENDYDEWDYTGFYDTDCIINALQEIKEELEEDPEGTHIINRIKEYEPNTVVTIEDIKRLCDWLQVCVDKGYVIYVD